MVQLSHPYLTTRKTIALMIWAFAGKVMSMLFNMLSIFCHSFSSKEQVSFNFMGAVTIHSDFGAQENKVCYCFHFFPFYWPWSEGLDTLILVFWVLSFKPAFSVSWFTLLKRLFSSCSLSDIRVVSSACRGCWYFSWQSSFQLVISPAWHFTWCTLHRSLISRVAIYSLVILLSQFWTSQLCHIQLDSHLKIFRNYQCSQLKW